MRVNILFYYLHGGGGAFSNVRLLLAALARVHPGDQFLLAGSESLDFGPALEFPNVRHVPIRQSGSLEWTRLRLGLGGLAAVCRRERADILWALNLGPYLDPGLPFVLGVNNPHQVYPTSVTRHHPGGALRVLLLQTFFRWSLRQADGVLVQTEGMGRRVLAAARRPLPCAVVAKSVEGDVDVTRSPLPLAMASQLAAPGWYRVLYVATAIPHKNHRVLVGMAKAFREAGEHVATVVTVTQDELQRLVGGTDIAALVESGHLVPVGWTKKEHLAGLYEAADACVMPSYIESLSSAHLEAMRWRRPQVCAEVEYARDLCDGASLYAAPDQPAEWVSAVRKLRDGRELGERLVNAGLARMQDMPSNWAEVAMRIRRFLGDIATRS